MERKVKSMEHRNKHEYGHREKGEFPTTRKIGLLVPNREDVIASRRLVAMIARGQKRASKHSVQGPIPVS